MPARAYKPARRGGGPEHQASVCDASADSMDRATTLAKRWHRVSGFLGTLRQQVGQSLSSPTTMKFDPDHLRIAAEVRAKAQRRRWFDIVAGLLALLIMAFSVV